MAILIVIYCCQNSLELIYTQVFHKAAILYCPKNLLYYMELFTCTCNLFTEPLR